MELLERQHQLDELGRLLLQSAGGSGSMAIIGGEAGAGKTSVIHRFAEQAQGSTRVMIGACDALSSPRPLGPLFDVAPSLGSRAQRLLRDVARRPELFSAVRDDLASRQPTLLVIEDVHWADEATLDLLRFLGRRIERTHALFVVTYRDDEIGSTHPLRILLGDLATARTVRRIAVPMLSERAVWALCSGTDFDGAELHRRTGGNPFYVSEVLASSTQQIPESVRDTILTRAARLSPEGRDVLDTAAAIGERVDPHLLATVVGSAATAADECIAVGLLRAAGANLQFRHQLAQQVVAGAISPVRSAAIHRKILEALTARPEVNRLAAVAHHAELAGDRDAVLEYAPAAAEYAAGLGSHREAAAQYERAIRHADHLPASSRASLLAAWFDEGYATNQKQRCDEVATQLIDLARERGDSLGQANWHTWLAHVLVGDGRNAEADASITLAIQLLEHHTPSPVHAFVYQSHSLLRMLNRDYAESISWGQRAVALAQQFDLPGIHAGALNAMGSARLIGIDEEQGRAELEEGLAIARATGNDTGTASLLGNLGSGHGEIYRFELAARHLTEGIEFTRERDLDSWHWYQVAWLALTHMFQGKWADATDHAASVVRMPSADAISIIMAQVALGRVRARRGDPEVWSALDGALELAEPTHTLQRLAPVREARAEAAWLMGNRERVVSEAAATYDLAVRYEHPWHIGELAYWRWKAGDVQASPSGAAEPYALQMHGDWATAAARWTELGCPYEAARALAESDDESALRESFATFDRLGARPMAASVAHRLRDIGATSIPRGPRPATRDNPAQLTSRELEVLELIAAGSTNMEIASRLFLSPKTIEHHVSGVLAKLDVRSRRDAARVAAEMNILSQSEGHQPPT